MDIGGIMDGSAAKSTRRAILEAGTATMIRNWLSSTPLESFLATHFEREPFVQPSTAADAVPLLDWDAVGRLLEARADVMTVRKGRLVPDLVPAHLEEARAVLRDGCSLVIRNCDLHDGGLSQLARAFEADIGGEAAIQAFVSPTGSRSFGWHYDCEDVFIAQTAGVKEYQLRRNTVNPAPTIDAMPRDMQYERETSTTVLACTLVPGDWLYVPRGWWHVGQAASDSLSISIGLLSDAARGSAPPRQRAAMRPAVP
jgi:ribosomal protein L16 Arg81 hydroxylase